jgi:serine/threonine protein kinase
LKAKTLVLVNPDVDSDVKVIDFGFASRVFAPKSLTRQCGTPLFVAPEVLKKEPYDQSSDMWSVGVIIYLLLGGTLPFLAANLKGLFQKIVAGKVEFSDKYWGNVSRDAKVFIKQLLVVDPDKRLSAKEALQSKWIRHVEKRSIMMNDLSASQRELKLFNAKMKLRAAMFAIDWVTTSFGTKRRSTETIDDAEHIKKEADAIIEEDEDHQNQS